MKIIDYTLIIIVFVTLLYMFYTYLYNMSNKDVCNKRLYNAILLLYRQSARWAAASLQDDSELIRLLHANYAAGYVWAIKDIITTEEFKHITGEDYPSFENKIVNIQDKSAKKLIDKCKNLLFLDDKTLLKAMYY